MLTTALGLGAVSPLAGSECTPVAPAATPPQSAQAKILQGAPWNVREVNGAAVPAGAHATMAFGADGRVTGLSFCNAYSGTYTTTGEGITIGQTIATRKACPPEVMKLEQAFLGTLRSTTRFTISNGSLVLHAAEGTTIRARRD